MFLVAWILVLYVCWLSSGQEPKSNSSNNTCGNIFYEVKTDVGPISSVLYPASKSLSLNETITGGLGVDEYAYYSICIPRHAHEHLIIINATDLQGETILYASCNIAYPNSTKASWILDSHRFSHGETRTLRLPTYVGEIPKDDGFPIQLYIGIKGKRPYFQRNQQVIRYQLVYMIEDLPMDHDTELRKQYYETKKDEWERKQVIASHMRRYQT